MRTRSIDLSHGRFFAKPPNFWEQKLTLARLVSRPLPSFPMREEERRLRGGCSMTVQLLYIGMVWIQQSKQRSPRPWKLRTTGLYSHIHWARRMPPLPPPHRKTPREFSERKAKPAGREGGGGRERTNLPSTAWTPKCGLIRTARFPTQTSSLLRHSSRRNPKTIFWICDLRE